MSTASPCHGCSSSWTTHNKIAHGFHSIDDVFQRLQFRHGDTDLNNRSLDHLQIWSHLALLSLSVVHCSAKITITTSSMMTQISQVECSRGICYRCKGRLRTRSLEHGINFDLCSSIDAHVHSDNNNKSKFGEWHAESNALSNQQNPLSFTACQFNKHGLFDYGFFH